jgi:hypothetical protein
VSSTQGAPGEAERRALLTFLREWRRAKRVQLAAFVLTLSLVGLGLGLLWLTKKEVGIEGDAVFVALLVVPLIVYLAFTNRLENFQIFGASASFRDLKETVTAFGQLEPERGAYLGKLNQVLEKDELDFCLLYADVDGLRQMTSDFYDKERRGEAEHPTDVHMPPERRTEEKIRKAIIAHLEFALTDAFYDVAGDAEDAKCDVFRLEDPDVVLIVRALRPREAKRIAEKALEELKPRCSATIALVRPRRADDAPLALAERAALALKEAKKVARGGVYTPE